MHIIIRNKKKKSLSIGDGRGIDGEIIQLVTARISTSQSTIKQAIAAFGVSVGGRPSSSREDVNDDGARDDC